MAFTQEKQGGRFNVKCASAAAAYLAVGPLVAASQLSETVIPVATLNLFPIALLRATVASPGDVAEIWQQGDVGKGIAGASMGAYSLVGVGSTNGVLAPVAVTAAGASGPNRWSVGMVLTNAVAGDVISVYVNPAQVL